MAVAGIGTDVCAMSRIAAAWSRHGQRFAARILGPDELLVFEHRRARWEARGLAYLATRFSAKEAFSKAIGLGLHSPMRWRDCQILNAASGRPEIRLRGALADWCAQRQLSFHVSVSDESDTVVSFVVAETPP